MTLEELDRQLKSDEELLVASLQELKTVKANYRKARITSIHNRLLAPFRRFKINRAILKYDIMMEKLEKKREKAIELAEKLQEKEEKRARKQAKEDFKAAIRDKRKEEITEFLNDKKDSIVSFGSEIKDEVTDTFSYIKDMGLSRVSRVSSFVINAKNSTLDKVRANTLIDLKIKNAIEDFKLRQATNKYNKALEAREKRKAEERLAKVDEAINFDEGVKIDIKNRDVPSSNIFEKVQKARKSYSYMGKATNRVVYYFKSKRDKFVTDVNEKMLDAKMEAIVNAYMVMGKISMAKSKVTTVFNNKIGDFLVAVSDRYADMKDSFNDFKGDINASINDRRKLKERKKDMIAALREQDEKEIAIKKAQLESMRETIASINNEEDVKSIDGQLKARTI